MSNPVKTGLQLLGTAAWGVFWIGGSVLLMKKDLAKNKKLSKEQDKKWRERRGLPPEITDEGNEFHDNAKSDDV